MEGELLVFSGSQRSSLTGSAQLGMVYAVPGAKRFLILFHRVELA